MLIRKAWSEEKLLDDWRKSITIPIFKQKGVSWTVETTARDQIDGTCYECTGEDCGPKAKGDCEDK